MYIYYYVCVHQGGIYELDKAALIHTHQSYYVHIQDSPAVYTARSVIHEGINRSQNLKAMLSGAELQLVSAVTGFSCESYSIYMHGTGPASPAKV